MSIPFLDPDDSIPPHYDRCSWHYRILLFITPYVCTKDVVREREKIFSLTDGTVTIDLRCGLFDVIAMSSPVNGTTSFVDHVGNTKRIKHYANKVDGTATIVCHYNYRDKPNRSYVSGFEHPNSINDTAPPKSQNNDIIASSAAMFQNIIPTTTANAVTDGLSTGLYNPDSFKPVCAASDSFYRLLQGSTRAVVGDENFSEYGPLIAGGLLRIRLELCVVESFFNEAVGPFIKENGLSWILPFHETVETFLAGTIFALATTFILVGSTKLIQIIAFYGDLVVGGPCRLFGGFFFDRARGEPVTLDVSFFGFFKTRLVGPPIDFKEEENRKMIEGEKSLLDFDNVKPTDIPLLAVSGGIKIVGEASRVSPISIIQVCSTLIEFLTLRVCRSFVNSLKHLICSLGGIWSLLHLAT
jgi:hypothetical protein